MVDIRVGKTEFEGVSEIDAEAIRSFLRLGSPLPPSPSYLSSSSQMGSYNSSSSDLSQVLGNGSSVPSANDSRGTHSPLLEHIVLGKTLFDRDSKYLFVQLLLASQLLQVLESSAFQLSHMPGFGNIDQLESLRLTSSHQLTLLQQAIRQYHYKHSTEFLGKLFSHLEQDQQDQLKGG